ncbi:MULTISPECIES: hypothetical protein [Clostridium]|nr:MULTISPECIES: hypothetical protein [Clostridium]
MFGYEYKSTISDAKIEERARDMGMHYEGECKVLFERDGKK